MKPRDYVVFSQHGVAYFIYKGEFCCAPMLKNGDIEWDTFSIVEESPQQFFEDHKSILNLLGIKERDIESYQDIIYYYYVGDNNGKETIR